MADDEESLEEDSNSDREVNMIEDESMAESVEFGIDEWREMSGFNEPSNLDESKMLLESSSVSNENEQMVGEYSNFEQENSSTTSDSDQTQDGAFASNQSFEFKILIRTNVQRIYPKFYIDNSQSDENFIRIEFLKATSNTTAKCFAETKLWTNSQNGKILNCEQILYHPNIDQQISSFRNKGKFYIRINGKQILKPSFKTKNGKVNECDLIVIGNEKIQVKSMTQKESENKSDKIQFETNFKNGNIVNYTSNDN